MNPFAYIKRRKGQRKCERGEHEFRMLPAKSIEAMRGGDMLRRGPVEQCSRPSCTAVR